MTSLSGLRRAKASKKTFPRFVIFFEGENTEPNYLEAWIRKNEYRKSLVIDIKRGQGGASTIAEKTIAEKVRKLSYSGKLDEVWGVFDEDGKSSEYNTAITKCFNKGVGVACSNPCFEVWAILHFECYNKYLSHNEVQWYLRDNHCPEYNPNGSKNLPSDKLMPLIATAEKNAKWLLKERAKDSEINSNPSTTFHNLIEALRNAAAESAKLPASV